MKLGNLILLWLGAIAVWFVCGLLGWALAFGFTYEVFVPWLGCVPPEYHKLAAFVSAFIFDGIGSFLVLFALVLGGLGAYRFLGRKR